MSVAMPLRTLSVRAFVENPIFLSSLTSFLTAQLIKTVIMLLKSRKKRAKEVIETLVWRTGGMPSSHVALVSSMAASAALVEGIGSNLFQISFWFALVVIRDALGVRRSSGLQARVLNVLGKQVSEQLDVDFHPLKEVHGHTPLEAAVGGLLGLFIAIAFAIL
ncbi:MAG: divergent PAP2 family protein [Treponema sp.]|nr:divergent PAP2 family protein [Treponema sp.]